MGDASGGGAGSRMTEDPPPPETLAAETGVPPLLTCPECRELMKNATELPCCNNSLCRPCAYKKLVATKKKCWFQTTPKCEGIITLGQLSPALEIRELIQDYIAGGTKYKDKEVVKDRITPDYIDCLDTVASTHRPIVQIKTENIVQDEEYSEMNPTGQIDLSRIKSENPPPLPQSFPLESFEAAAAFLPASDAAAILPRDDAPAILPCDDAGAILPRDNMAARNQDLCEEYSELPLQNVPFPKLETSEQAEGMDGFKFQDALKKESGLDEDELFPNPTTLPNTPSSARTEHQSSGYWSDDSYEGAFFGKLEWDEDDPSRGFIECWDNGEKKRAHVSRYEVKCGAESGDLVEFTLRTHPEHGKVAKRVKLVEKALPRTDEDQIKSQANLKRSLEISARLSNKKIKTEDVIDAETELQSMSSTYLDIAAEDVEEPPSPTLPWHTANVKSEFGMFGVMQEEPVSDVCICNGASLSRCGVCPLYFLRSETQHTILEGESVTLVARIEGLAEDQSLEFVRHLPFPFLVPQGAVDFSLLSTLGPKSIVKKVTPVFKQNYAFVSMMNDSEYQVNISPGNVLGICQAHQTEDPEVSRHFILEPPDRQEVGPLPLTVKRKDFSRENNFVSGFAEIGDQGMNYKFCLVKIKLLPEYAAKFGLLKDELTVQVKRNVWLELLPTGKGFQNLLPKVGGVIGEAVSVMTEAYVEEMFRSVSPVSSAPANRLKPCKDEGKEDPEAAYRVMMSKLNQDISVVGSDESGKSKTKVNIINTSETFRGVNSELVSILPGREQKVVLFLHSDSDYDPKNLLKMQVDITNNEEFKYYNNCYNILPQVCKVVNSHCKLSNSFRPSVKVLLTNPRLEVASLQPNSSVALVKVHKGQDLSKERHRKSQDGTVDDPVGQEEEEEQEDDFSATSALEELEHKYLRSWDRILEEDTFKKSLVVEEKYPYFNEKPKPKIPFGLKLDELLMRVGVSQHDKPTRVLDKVSGVFNCTICDTIILDKYTLQDHIYSDKHKQGLKSVQVIAGFEERLYMNRPVLQEYLDSEQFRDKPLLGLDHIFEVLDLTKQTANYHCSLCNTSQTVRELLRHVISTGHVFAFLKEFFPAAWAKLSNNQDTDNWSRSDLDRYFSILSKLHTVYGQRRPTIVADEAKLEEAVDRLPVADQYLASRTEVDAFFKSLKFSHRVVRKRSSTTGKSRTTRTISRLAVTTQFKSIAPGALERIVCRVSRWTMVNMPSGARSLNAKFVLINRIPSNTYCVVKPGLSRVFVKDQMPCVYVNIYNSSPDSNLEIEPNLNVALIKWKK